MGRSRGGLTTKIHVVTDARGLPIRLCLTSGQDHDISVAEDLLSHMKKGEMLLADKAYGAKWLREMLFNKGAWANIPPKSNSKSSFVFSPYLYKQRNLVERFFNKIKFFRRIATRYDKLGQMYLAMVKLASIRIILRFYEPTA